MLAFDVLKLNKGITTTILQIVLSNLKHLNFNIDERNLFQQIGVSMSQESIICIFLGNEKFVKWKKFLIIACFKEKCIYILENDCQRICKEI